jgi:AcrR family transcriptional regulator
MTSPGLRERKKQKTRWAIQEHALRLFQEQGYDQTTVEQIAAAAEVSPSTFFRYFATKEDVVIQDEYDPLLAAGIDDAPAGLNPIAAVRHAINAAFDGADPAELRRLRERTALIMSVPALRARTLDNLNASVRLVAEPLARRIGVAPDDLRARAWAGAIIGVALAALEEWISGDDDAGFAVLMDRALAELEAGFPGTGAA